MGASPDFPDPAGSQALRAAVEASVDTIHPLVAQRDAHGAVRSFTAADGTDVAGEPWFDLLAFLGAMESGTTREDHIEGSGTTLLRRAENAALRRVATTVAGQADSDVVFDYVAREVAQLLGAESGRVARFEEGEAEVVGIWGDEAGSLDLRLKDGRAVTQVASTGRPARVDDYQALRAEDPAAADATPDTYRSSVAAPVFVGHKLWGGVVAISTSTARAFDEQDEGRLERFSELLSMAIANADERAQLEAAANVDGLTALANHRAFQERLATEVKRARRYGRQLSLAIFDIDHFKHVNLVHGHESGDRLLTEVGRRMNAVSRAGELVARTGGEEFAWILPGADAISAFAASERLRAAIAAAATPLASQITVSAGVCDLEQARDATQLVDFAKGALYWAKQHGRDCSFVYSPDVVEVLSAAERAERLERTQALAGLRAMARAVDAKDPSTQRHSERVADLAAMLAGELGWKPDDIAAMREAGLVHDVGKIGVPDAIPFKNGKLTDEEYARVKLHAPMGAEIAAEVLSEQQVAWVRGHHERWDGRGYPDGLAGLDITEGGRILALADAVDVMTGARHYREPVGWQEALEECRRCSGSQFDPSAVAALEHAWADGPPAAAEPAQVNEAATV